MSDDAEFDAFLNGQGDLARSLQALPQSAPSAALDAAILANARAAMTQEVRPQAANDSGGAAPAPQLARSLGWRWRIPAGIAATVLVGVFAQRSFESNPDLNDLRAPVMMEESSPIPAPEMPPPPPPMEPAVDATRAQDVANAAPPPVQKPAAPPAPRAEPAAPAVRAPQEFARKAPAPQNQVREARAAEKSAMAPAVQADRVQGDKVQADRGPEAISNNIERDDRAPALSSAPAPAAAPPAPPAAAAVAEQVQVNARRRQFNYASGKVESAAAAGDSQLTPRAWLDRIEQALAEGRRDEAVADWKTFRKAHPTYPVPDSTRSKLE